jgi:hypothetical protein
MTTYEKTGTVAAGTRASGDVSVRGDVSVLTPNQVIAHNLHQARVMRGLTQEQAAERLEPFIGRRWSVASWSAAERSVTGERPREFTADEMIAFARCFELPPLWFMAPPAETREVALPGPAPNQTRDDYLAMLVGGDVADLEDALRDASEQLVQLASTVRSRASLTVKLVPATETDTAQPLTYTQGGVQRRGSDGQPLGEGES